MDASRKLRLLLPVALPLAFAGCTKHPQVSYENLRYVAALRTACSAQNAEWLAAAAAAIDRERDAGAIGDDEFESYRVIIETAEGGDWAAAERECLRFQKDQLAK